MSGIEDDLLSGTSAADTDSFVSGVFSILNSTVIPFNGMFDAAVSAVQSALGQVGGLIEGATSLITGSVTDALPTVLAGVTGLPEGAIGTITDVFSNSGEALNEAMTTGMMSSITSLASTPSISDMQAKATMITGMENSIQNVSSSIREDVSLQLLDSGVDEEVIGTAVAAASTQFNSAVSDAATQKFDKMADTMITAKEKAGGWDKVQQAVDQAKNTLTPMSMPQPEGSYLNRLETSRGFDLSPDIDSIESTATVQEVIMRTKEALFDKTIYSEQQP